jgi:hypothetical protein
MNEFRILERYDQNGEFIDDKDEEFRHGYGIHIWPNGAYYEGYWTNNKAEGIGTYCNAEGDILEG